MLSHFGIYPHVRPTQEPAEPKVTDTATSTWASYDYKRPQELPPLPPQQQRPPEQQQQHASLREAEREVAALRAECRDLEAEEAALQAQVGGCDL